MKLIIDIPEEIYNPFMRGNYSEWVSDWLSTHEYSLIRNGTPIPNDTTNGDIIKALYPNSKIGNLCDSCMTKGCIFQSEIVRNRCDFYKAESEE